MTSKHLRLRANWQTVSGAKALKAEELFVHGLQVALDDAFPHTFIIDKNPQEFSHIYSNFVLPHAICTQIFDVTPPGHVDRGWGIKMDFAIRNILNKKTIFGEIKRQDGWVEGGKPSDGRGNAHERCCKYFTPGLHSIIQHASNITTIFPVLLVFVGNITRDPKRNREIAFWFQGYERNYFLWRDTSDVLPLLTFFEDNLLDHLL